MPDGANPHGAGHPYALSYHTVQARQHQNGLVVEQAVYAQPAAASACSLASSSNNVTHAERSQRSKPLTTVRPPSQKPRPSSKARQSPLLHPRNTQHAHTPNTIQHAMLHPRHKHVAIKLQASAGQPWSQIACQADTPHNPARVPPGPHHCRSRVNMTLVSRAWQVDNVVRGSRRVSTTISHNTKLFFAFDIGLPRRQTLTAMRYVAATWQAKK